MICTAGLSWFLVSAIAAVPNSEWCLSSHVRWGRRSLGQSSGDIAASSPRFRLRRRRNAHPRERPPSSPPDVKRVAEARTDFSLPTGAIRKLNRHAVVRSAAEAPGEVQRTHPAAVIPPPQFADGPDAPQSGHDQEERPHQSAGYPQGSIRELVVWAHAGNSESEDIRRSCAATI